MNRESLNLTIDSEIGVISDSFIVHGENNDPAAVSPVDLEDEDDDIEPNLKRQLETIADVDFEIERILTKYIRHTKEHANIPSGIYFRFSFKFDAQTMFMS